MLNWRHEVGRRVENALSPCRYEISQYINEETIAFPWHIFLDWASEPNSASMMTQINLHLLGAGRTATGNS